MSQAPQKDVAEIKAIIRQLPHRCQRCPLLTLFLESLGPKARAEPESPSDAPRRLHTA